MKKERAIAHGLGILGVTTPSGDQAQAEARSMHQLIASLAPLVEPFRDSFHPAVFATFQSLIAGWVVCLGPHTISGVWQATGLAAKRHHDTALSRSRRVWSGTLVPPGGCPTGDREA